MWKKSKKIISILVSAGIVISSMQTYAVQTSNNITVVPQSLDDGLVIDFNMDSMTNNALINAADDNAFEVLGNNPQLTTSKEGHGQALLLDGSTNYMNLGTGYQFTTGAFTIAAWVKIDTAPNGLSRIICRSRTAVPYEKDLALYVRNNGKLEVQANYTDYLASGENAVKFGEWQHVAVTDDGSQMKLYINGEVVQTGNVSSFTSDQWDIPLLVGAGWNNAGDAPFAGHMFKGCLDDLKVYNRGLSADEIKTLADVEESGSNDDELPKALYEFTMNEIKDGTGELTGQKVIESTDGTQYPIYGGAQVDSFGIYDQSILFNGTDSYVDIGKPSIHNEYTMSAWIYLENGAVNNMNKLFGRDRTTVADRMFYAAIRGDRQGEIDFALDGTGISAPAGTVPFGEWVNIAFTNTPEKASLYINGNLISTVSGSSADQSTHPLNLLIGCGYNAAGDGIYSGHAFKGRIDDVRIYDQALTAAQIKKNTEGILEQIPPEINEVSPLKGSLIGNDGKVQITYNMAIELGDQKITVMDQDGNEVDAVITVEDTVEKVEGNETLLIAPKTLLQAGKKYTYTIPEDAVVNENGIGNLETVYTYVVKQGLEGNAAESGLEYWVIKGKADLDSSITEKEGKVVIENGLISRTFDINQNFLTVAYNNLYTGISLLDEEHLQADVMITLNNQYVDGESETDYPCYVGGVDHSLPTFKYAGYTVENNVIAPYHWEYDERISPEYMKDAKWPAEGKALVVDFVAPEGIDSIYAGVKVSVRYEIYDGIPVISKSVTVTNEGVNDVIVHHLTTEALPAPTSLQDAIFMDSDMNAGNNNHDRNNGQYVFKQWESSDDASGVIISRYAISTENQTNMHGLDCNNFGPNYRLKQNESFESYKLYELFHSTSYYEWQTLEVKKMYRVLFPQTMDAPLIYHAITSDPASLRKSIDEAANAGFNMVLMSFGSGIDTENTDPAYMAKYKEIFDYAHEKGILMGAYMMLTARGGGDTHGGIWGTMRCDSSEATQDTIARTITFIQNTGLDCLEIDGSYPGALCDGENHAGHEGIEDSVTKQWEVSVRDYYKQLREYNVYINAPDWHYMAGASMGVMGYVEEGFNATRKAQLIYSREMSYYGTFEKLPSMGWTLVPLSPYKGGDSSSFWPYNERIYDYDFIIGVNMLYGVVGSYRGANGLYQEGPAQNVMETWGEFYNHYREVLNGDIIHIAPPVRDTLADTTTKAIDGFIHVSTESQQKGLAAFFNQTTETVTQKVQIPLYFTGLTDLTTAPAPVKDSHYRLSHGVGGMLKMPTVPDIPEIEGTPTDKKAIICIGDMDPQEVTIDSNGNVEVELMMEPDTYTWITIYDPNDVPEDLINAEDIPAVANLSYSELTSSKVTLTWDAVEMNGREVKEYYVYKNGEYIGKTFTNQYVDETLVENSSYTYEVAAVYNTVAGEKASIEVNTTKDVKAPELISAQALSKKEVEVVFNEVLDQTSAIVVSNYVIAGNSISKAVLSADRKSVVLTLNNELQPFVNNTLTIQHVKDLAGNEIGSENKKDFVFGYLREFKFEEESGNTAIDTILGKDGIIFGDNLVRNNGISGQGLSFDGKINYVNIGDVVSPLNEYSISGWFNPEDVQKNQTLIGQQRENYDGWRWNLYIENGELKFVINNGQGSYPGNDNDENEIAVALASRNHKIEADKWNQFTIVRNQDIFSLYLNGEKVAEKTQTGIDQNGTPYASWLGGYGSTGGGDAVSCFKGMMDEVVYYNTPLTNQNVQDLYAQYRADKNELKLAIEEAETFTEELYTEASWENFTKALNNAKAILNKEDASQEEVDNAKEALVQTQNGLAYKDADYSAVDAAIEAANRLNKDDYKDFSAVEKAIDAVVRGKNITEQEAVDAMAKAIEDAIAALEENEDIPWTPIEPSKVNKEELDKAIEDAKAINTSKYTEESVAVLDQALADAEKVLADKEATQAEVNAATAKLNSAIKGLVEKTTDPEEPVDPEDPTEPTDPEKPTEPETPSTSDTMNIMVLATIMMISGLAFILLSKRKKEMQ